MLADLTSNVIFSITALIGIATNPFNHEQESEILTSFFLLPSQADQQVPLETDLPIRKFT